MAWHCRLCFEPDADWTEVRLYRSPHPTLHRSSRSPMPLLRLQRDAAAVKRSCRFSLYWMTGKESRRKDNDRAVVATAYVSLNMVQKTRPGAHRHVLRSGRARIGRYIPHLSCVPGATRPFIKIATF